MESTVIQVDDAARRRRADQRLNTEVERSSSAHPRWAARSQIQSFGNRWDALKVLREELIDQRLQPADPDPRRPQKTTSNGEPEQAMETAQAKAVDSAAAAQSTVSATCSKSSGGNSFNLLATSMLMTTAKLVIRATGRSPGATAPTRILSACSPAR